ncbi:MFS transporter [Actinacidiphila oryziradicis]|uniref:MFS transporter n=1 Tax=Actinacidiphila oryziradicis TaxID=2571141 RepID=UPI0023F28ED2|nr:MFS transporter [Actinacidiphila oryziradicis]MCW2875772.1 multidrug transporter [Actinacidiphila oryziradicis]
MKQAMKDIPKAVWLLAAGMFVVAAVSFTFVYLFVYLTGPRGLSTSEAGLIAGIGGVGMVAGNFTGGWFGDHLGHRRTVIAGMVVSGAGLALLPLVPTGALLILFPVCQYGTGMTRASNGALIAFSVPEGSRRQGFALLRFFANAGVTVGPPLGALIAAHYSYGWLFVADGAGMLFFAVWAAMILPANGKKRQRKEDLPADAPSLWTALRGRPAVLVVLGAVLVADTIYRQQYSTLPVFLDDHGFSTGFYGALIAINGGLVILLELPVTVALRRRAPLLVIGSGLLLVALGYAALIAGGHIATAIVMMALLTVGDILYKSPSTAYVADHAPDHLQGRFQSMYSGASISGVVLAAPLGGVLYQAAPGLLWPLCTALGVAAAIAVLGAHRRHGLRPALADQSPVSAAAQS